MAKIPRILVCWPDRYGGREGVEGGEGMIVPLKEADTETQSFRETKIHQAVVALYGGVFPCKLEINRIRLVCQADLRCD